MEHNTNILDYLFLIPTYERYDMLVDLINQINEQCEGMEYKIAVMDDCSKDYRYNNLGIEYPNVIYKSNPTNLGKLGFVTTINKLFEESKNNQAKHYVFLADDLALSKNFIPYISDLFDKGHKIINFFLFQDRIYTNWGYRYWVDGAFAINHEMLSKLDKPLVGQQTKVVPSSGVWRDFTRRMDTIMAPVYYPKYSFVDHLGHTDSTMHPEDRKKSPVFITNYIDDNKEWDIYRPQVLPPPKNLKEKKRREKEAKLLAQRKLTLAKAASDAKNREPKHIEVKGNTTESKKKFISEVQHLKKKKTFTNGRQRPIR